MRRDLWTSAAPVWNAVWMHIQMDSFDASSILFPQLFSASGRTFRRKTCSFPHSIFFFVNHSVFSFLLVECSVAMQPNNIFSCLPPWVLEFLSCKQNSIIAMILLFLACRSKSVQYFSHAMVLRSVQLVQLFCHVHLIDGRAHNMNALHELASEQKTCNETIISIS